MPQNLASDGEYGDHSEADGEKQSEGEANIEQRWD